MPGRIAVLGSFNVDMKGRADHLPKPAESVLGSSFSIGPGGKGSNQAVAAHRAGADVIMITKVGGDIFKSFLFDFYKQEGLCCDYVFTDETQKTGVALIVVDENTGQNQIVALPGASKSFCQSDIEKARPVIESSCILLLQHEVNLDANWMAIDIAEKKGVKVVLNPAPAEPIPDEIYKKVDIITPNEVEASILCGIDVISMTDAAKAADIFQKRGVRDVVITMGKNGAYIRSGSRDAAIERHNVDAVDTTGAGDVFSGALVAALVEGKDIFESAKFANAAAALSVTAYGAAKSAPIRSRIDEFMREKG